MEESYLDFNQKSKSINKIQLANVCDLTYILVFQTCFRTTLNMPCWKFSDRNDDILMIH